MLSFLLRTPSASFPQHVTDPPLFSLPQDPSSAAGMDLELFEALLANMQQNLPQGAYDELDDDDDDDDYDEDDDEDDDDDYEYGGHEHNIHTMSNPYQGVEGGVGGGEMGGGDMCGVSLPTMQTMSILQGLLNINPAALPGGGADMGGAMSSPMNAGMPGMGAPMDGGAGSFLSNMPSFLPSMNPDMAGALAGAFAGGMGALMDSFAGAGGGAQVHDYDEDDEILSDEEDEEDDDDDDDIDERGHGGMGTVAAAAAGVAAVGAVGGMMTSGLLGTPHPSAGPGHPVGPVHPVGAGHPALAAHAPMPGHPMSAHGGHPQHPGHVSMAGHGPPVGFTHPGFNPADMLSAPPSSVAQMPPHSMPPHVASPMHHTSMAPSMSGGSVRSVDPLAGVVMGAAGVAAGAGILAPVVGSLLSAAGGKSLQKLDNSDASSTTMVGDDSLNSSSKTVAAQERPASAPSAVAAITKALEKTHITPPSPSAKKDGDGSPPEKTSEQNESEEDEPEEEDAPKPSTRVSTPKDELEDDKASVGAESVPSSEEAGDGKSDTESVRKKTPSPVLTGKLGRLSPTGSESTPVLESASCASITDLASATESMRDSDTDNHSDAHNVTANLSDLDNDLHETQPKMRAPPQYAVGALPIVIEKPTFGWQSMVGLDTAKDALKNLFMSEAFPEVFEGTQGTCKGVLLFGPSGSGKTCLARALAKETNDAILIGISTAYLASQAPLEAPKIVRYLFDHARMHTPAVILFDEVDALCYDRSSQTALRAKAELLAQIRGTSSLPVDYC